MMVIQKARIVDRVTELLGTVQVMSVGGGGDLSHFNFL